jgi:hypothetical protein
MRGSVATVVVATVDDVLLGAAWQCPCMSLVEADMSGDVIQ